MDKFERRDFLLACAAMAAPAGAAGQSSPVTATSSTARFRKPASAARRVRPMTAAEEASAARAVAESIADQSGEPMHPAVAMSPRIPGLARLFDGVDYSEAQSRGKLLIVFYWASWCPICKVVAPKLNELYQRQHVKGLELLALSTDTALQPAYAHWQRSGWKFPTTLATAARLPEFMDARVLPTVMVRSKLGIVVSVDEGEVDEDDFRNYLLHL